MRYEALAPYYDALMHHVKYGEWVRLISKVIDRYIPEKTVSIIEMGGGTGILGNMLIEKGYRYTGSDYSFCMAREAQKKGLGFFCGDARFLPVKQRFDLAIFLYDGINYLLSLKDYQKIFTSVALCLKERGFFLFDVTTEENSYRYFFDHYDYQEYGPASLIRHSFYNPAKSLQTNEFTIFTPTDQTSGLYEKSTELHVQKVFTAEEIDSAIRNSAFDCIGIWDGYTTHRYKNHSERIHFLLQKK